MVRIFPLARLIIWQSKEQWFTCVRNSDVLNRRFNVSCTIKPLKCLIGKCALHLTVTDFQKVKYDSNSGLLFSMSTCLGILWWEKCSHTWNRQYLSLFSRWFCNLLRVVQVEYKQCDHTNKKISAFSFSKFSLVTQQFLF